MNEWNQNDFNGFLEQGASGLIYFYTPLCGTCQLASRMLTIVEELVDVTAGKMNLNYYPEKAIKFGIESVPCLVFLENGEVVETIYAFHSVPYLLEKIKQFLK